jgi:hypothetical protein
MVDIIDMHMHREHLLFAERLHSTQTEEFNIIHVDCCRWNIQRVDEARDTYQVVGRVVYAQ